jgi:hypothetical protein
MLFLAMTAGVHAQGTAFSYQGRLNSAGSPANGSYDLAFTLFATNAGGTPTAGPITNLATPVSNGLFVAAVDFGPGVFTGSNFWLDIAVRTNGGVSFSGLAPRQPITPIPYAVMANSASNLLGALPATQLTGTILPTQIPGLSWSNITSGLPVTLSGYGITNGQPTNANLSALAGYPNSAMAYLAQLSNSNGASLTNLVFKTFSHDFGITGIGDETAKIQAAFNYTSGPVIQDISCTASNLLVTNGTYIVACGATIFFNTNITGGDCIYIGQYVTNAHLENVIVNGQKAGFAGHNYSVCWEPSSNGSVFQDVLTPSAQRTGFHFGNFNTNTILFNCRAQSFSWAGFIIDGWGVSFPVPTNGTTAIKDCVAQDCWQGFLTTNSGEYIELTSCSAYECGMGFAIISGNDMVHGGAAVDCGIGAYVGGFDTDPNPAHSMFIGVDLNHNDITGICRNFNNGESFIGCSMLGGGGFYASNTAGVKLLGCTIGSTVAISCDGSNYGGTLYSGVNSIIACDVTGYPNLTSSNGGVFACDGFILEDGAAGPRTNSFSNVFTVPITASGSILATNASFPGPAISNGASMLWNSNAFIYLRTSRIGATNWSETLIASPP